jgi:acyl carrier protein
VPYVAPRSAAEQVIAEIWQEVLGIGQIGVDDDFFALGGHSLLGTQVVFRIRDAFQVTIPLHRIFDQPTVAGLTTTLLAESAHPEVIEKTADILIRLSGLSDAEVHQALGSPDPGPETTSTRASTSTSPAFGTTPTTTEDPA